MPPGQLTVVYTTHLHRIGGREVLKIQATQAPSKAEFHPLFKMDSGIMMTKCVIYTPPGHTTIKCQHMITCSQQNTELCQDT